MTSLLLPPSLPVQSPLECYLCQFVCGQDFQICKESGHVLTHGRLRGFNRPLSK